MSRLARMHRWSRWLPAIIPAGLIAIIASQPQAAHAQAPIISAVYTQGGGLFNYNFSVQNLGSFTLADISITVGSASVLNPVAPTGFQIAYDPGLGLVDFLADNNAATPQDFFAGTTVSGFRFTSNTLLNGARFDATDDQGIPTNGTVRATAVAAPEPGTLGLFAFAGMPFAAALVSRRRFAASRTLKG